MLSRNQAPKRVAGGFLPQPPHHPACGSASRQGRDSQSMPSLSRAFSAPQFFDNLQGIIGIGQYNAALPNHLSGRIHCV